MLRPCADISVHSRLYWKQYPHISWFPSLFARGRIFHSTPLPAHFCCQFLWGPWNFMAWRGCKLPRQLGNLCKEDALENAFPKSLRRTEKDALILLNLSRTVSITLLKIFTAKAFLPFVLCKCINSNSYWCNINGYCSKCIYSDLPTVCKQKDV